MRSAVIAGGQARRFNGRPKGLEKIAGKRILDRVVDALAEATGELPTLIANAPDANSWREDLEVVTDAVPGCGSLGGIYTAIVSGDGPVIVVAWDMPFVPALLLRKLAAGSRTHDVFLPASGGPRGVEPLCGVYGPACAEPVRRQLDAEDYRAIGFHEHVNVGCLPLEQVKACGDIDTLFFNVNTDADLRKAEELCQKRA